MIVAPALALLALTASTSQASSEFERHFEQGFESTPVGDLPPDFQVPPGVAAETVSDPDAADGRRCILVERVDEAARVPFVRRDFILDRDLRGRRVRASAMLVPAGGDERHAWMMMRVHRAEGRRPDRAVIDSVRSTDTDGWTRHALTTTLPDVEGRLAIFFFASVGSELRIDDFAFEVGPRPPAPPQSEAPKPLAKQAVKNLVAATRLITALRLFHPSDECSEVDWESFTREALRAAEGPRKPLSLARALRPYVEAVAPTVSLRPRSADPPAAHEALAADHSRSIGWVHRGWRGSGDPGRSIYSNERRTQDHPAERVIELELGAGIVCTLPLELPVDGQGTLPRGEGWTAPKPRYGHGVYEDRGTRLAAVAHAWGVLRHFYPYHADMKTKWDDVLGEALADAAVTPDGAQFGDVLRRMLADLRDGHARVTGVPLPPRKAGLGGQLPLRWRWIDGDLIVTWIERELLGVLAPGDRIVEIDGRKIGELLAEEAAYFSASTDARLTRSALESLRHGPRDGSLSLEVKRRSIRPRTKRLDVDLVGDERTIEAPRPGPLTELGSGAWYIDLRTVTAAELEETLDRLVLAERIVVDMRAYPDASVARVLRHLQDGPVRSSTWLTPTPRSPVTEETEYSESATTWKPLEPRLLGRTAVLVDESTISWGETCVSFVENGDLALIVGNASAGTNGNVTSEDLPGGARIHWTGLRVVQPDGACWQGRGVRIDVPVEPTAEDYAAGRDPWISAALDALR